MTHTRVFRRRSGPKAVPAAFAILAAAAISLTACATGTSSVSDTAWGFPDTDGKPSISFAADGSVTGSDGCNTLTGSWTEEEANTAELMLASTLRYCEGVDTWLSGAASATVKNGKLVVSDSDGKELGTLEEAYGAGQ